MVDGDLNDIAAPQQIGAAVAGPKASVIAVEGQQHDDGGAHRADAAQRRLPLNIAMRALQGGLALPAQLRRSALRGDAAQTVDDHGAGRRASGVAAHAVRHGEKAHMGLGEEIILILRTHAALVGEREGAHRAKIGHAAHCSLAAGVKRPEIMAEKIAGSGMPVEASA